MSLSPSSLLALLRRAVVFELRLYRSLLRWIARRPDVKGDEVFGYARAVTPVLWLWIFASAIEIPFFHLLIPWESVRIAGLALSAWGLIWMVGFLASLQVYPHLLGDSTLRVRHGASVDIRIPLETVAKVARDRRDLESTVWTLQPRETERGTDLQVGVSGQVNVHLTFKRPLTVPTPKGPMVIAELSFLTDDPAALVARVRRELTAADGHSRGSL